MCDYWRLESGCLTFDFVILSNLKRFGIWKLNNALIKTQILLLLSIFLSLIFVSCKDTKTVEAKHILKEWIGKTILFPEIESTYYVVGKDSLNYISETSTISKDYKILLYIDSTGCTSCRLRLYIWKTYIEEFDSKIDFLFYFQPKSEKELSSLLENEQFAYPVYIDNKGELNRLNQFPDNSIFQCFLLDKDNKVVAIGNPIHNSQVGKLYKQIITGEMSGKPLVTTVEPEQTEIELKDLQTGRISEAIFVLKNTGTNPLVIHQVESSCGCTVPKWEKVPIITGKSANIKVEITPGKKEYFNKSVIVHCNNEQGKIMLLVKGIVK
jgi:hypothetical protein